jgi:hypothetical protein
MGDVGDVNATSSIMASITATPLSGAIELMREAWRNYKWNICTVAAVCSLWPTMYYIDMVWLVSMQDNLIDPPNKAAFAVNTGMLL